MDTGAAFPDNSKILFGREPDLEHLLSRIKHPGLTVVVARPQMGKTWLLQELGRHLTKNTTVPYLVGYFESRGEGEDSLLRALIDLYTRWLSNAAYAEQAKLVWVQNKDKLLAGVTDTIGSVIDKLGSVFSEPSAKLIGKTLQSLTSANTTLQNAGLQIQPLQYDQARDLVRTVNKVTQYPIVLILDGWEQSRTLEVGINILHSFLRHLDDWPHIHIIVGMRQEDPAITKVEAIIKDQPTRAERYPLPIMHLEDTDASQALLNHIHKHITLEAELTDDELLKLIDGYPAVVNRWTDRHSAIPVDSVRTLIKLAEDAHANRFSEFEVLLPELDKEDERPLAMRLALIPTLNEEWWQRVKPQILTGLDEELLDNLCYKKIIEQSNPPSYGHDKRRDAALNWFQTNRNIALSREAEILIYELAAQIKDTDNNTLAFASLLLALRPHQDLSLSPICHALLEANATLFGIKADSTQLTKLQTHRANYGPVAPLLAIGLVNTHADTSYENNQPYRNALLEVSRQLARNHAGDAVVRKWLAIGMFNTLIGTKDKKDLQSYVTPLKGLRQLTRDHADDPSVIEWFAKGLFNALIDAKSKKDLEHRNTLLEELRQLVRDHIDKPTVRKQLAKGLFNTLNQVKEENNLLLRNALLAELRQLANTHADEPAVRKRLAWGLVNTLNHTKDKNDHVYPAPLLEELRQLAKDHTDESALRESLAMGLGSTCIAYMETSQQDKMETLLEEFTALTQNYPEDAKLQELLSMLVKYVEEMTTSADD